MAEKKHQKVEQRFVAILKERKELKEQIVQFTKLTDAHDQTIQELEEEVQIAVKSFQLVFGNTPENDCRD